MSLQMLLLELLRLLGVLLRLLGVRLLGVLLLGVLLLGVLLLGMRLRQRALLLPLEQLALQRAELSLEVRLGAVRHCEGCTQ